MKVAEEKETLVTLWGKQGVCLISPPLRAWVGDITSHPTLLLIALWGCNIGADIQLVGLRLHSDNMQVLDLLEG